tara:strand:- start:283 stop:462 length:180 start_codon:yes stop_codon:yes gene_type:complete
MNQKQIEYIKIHNEKIDLLKNEYENDCPCCGIDLIEGCCIDCGEVYADTISGDADRDER